MSTVTRKAKANYVLFLLLNLEALKSQLKRQNPVYLLLKSRRLGWFGHASLMGQERLPKAFSAEMDASEREASKGKVPHVVEGMEQDLESVASDGSPQ